MEADAPKIHLHGWLLLDKPVGIGSTPCVSAVKRALRNSGYAKVKVGHGGTLDPLASGVLPIALGEATKLAGRMLDATKAYRFTIRFGAETDTLDLEGQVVEQSDVRPTLGEVEAVLGEFRGEIEQLPPAYSALKVDGRRAYSLARAGETVVLEPRRVRVIALEIVAEAASPARPTEPVEEVILDATVSKGTYVRSLARDIARALGTVGHVSALRRIRAGPFGLDRAIALDKLDDLAKSRELDGAILPLAAGLDDIPALPVNPEESRSLREGRPLPGTPAMPGLYLATDEDRPVALVELSASAITVVRGFNL